MMVSRAHDEGETLPGNVPRSDQGTIVLYTALTTSEKRRALCGRFGWLNRMCITRMYNENRYSPFNLRRC